MTQTTDMPASLPALVAARATESPSRIIMRRKARGIWQAITWAAMADQVGRIASGLHALGIGRGDTVAIIAETSPETAYVDIAAQTCGAASLIIPGGAEASRMQHCLRTTASRIVFVEDEEQLDKILTIRGNCPTLSQVVIFDMKGLRDFRDPQCTSLARFQQSGQVFDWAQAARDLPADQPAAILFPNDDPSVPGQMLLQRDMIAMLAAARTRLGLKPTDERLALLSMSHPIERFWGLYAALERGCISNYPEGLDTALENLRELQPTVLGADAAMWAHLHAQATHAAADATTVQRLLYNWATRTASRGGPLARVADALVLRAVRGKFGLSRVHLAYAGGEAVAPPAADWARSLSIRIQRIDALGSPEAPHERRYDPFLQQAHA